MKIYDLTATIDTGLWYYGAPYIPYQTKKLATVADNGYITYEHVMTSHTGTHLECAKHWWDEAEGVEQIPLEKVMGKAKVLRIDCGQQALFAIDEKMLADAGGDNLQPGDICIIATGWDRQIREERYIWESPFITVGAAAYLVINRLGPLPSTLRCSATRGMAWIMYRQNWNSRIICSPGMIFHASWD